MRRLLFFTLWLLHACAPELITVETSRGAVQGFDQDFGDDKSKLFYGYGQVFLGIPFAKPPLGMLRFQLPEPICLYDDRGEVHNATYYRPRCWQQKKNVEMDEDCLYLNVMTPNITGNYPVMVYIHGGTFSTGGADKFHWKGVIRNLVSRGVVVVTIQYRLSMMGFFTTFTENFPPNRGMYDQILALRWVKEEIANFGGDSNRITIFGDSAGGDAVADLSLSPLARGLFHNVIESSGSTLSEIETIENPRYSIHQNRAREICQINSTDWGSPEKDEALLDCLLKAKPEDLVAFDFSCLTDRVCWCPAIDGAFLPDYPDNLAKSRPKYSALIGHMLEDFAAFIPGIEHGDISNITSQSNQYLFQLFWPNYDDATAKNISDTMIAGYSDGTIPADDDHLGWTKFITEMNTGLGFSAFQIRDVKWYQQAGNENLWLFTFTHRSLLPSSIEIDGWIPVFHGDETPYLWFFPNKWESFNASDADFAVADQMGTLWTEFAKNGALPLPRVGDAMHYVEIAEYLTLKKNWNSKADRVYNQQIPSYLGEFPPLKVSDESWKRMNEMGEKVLAKWNSNKCPAIPTVPTVLTTTKCVSMVSILSVAMTLCFLTIGI